MRIRLNEPVCTGIEDLHKTETDGGIQASVIFGVQERALELFRSSSDHIWPTSDLPSLLPWIEPGLNPDTSGHPRLGAQTQQVETGQEVNLWLALLHCAPGHTYPSPPNGPPLTSHPACLLPASLANDNWPSHSLAKGQNLRGRSRGLVGPKQGRADRRTRGQQVTAGDQQLTTGRGISVGGG